MEKLNHIYIYIYIYIYMEVNNGEEFIEKN